jgi:hypothetical protein
MKALIDYSDDQQQGFCIYCGGPAETRDHVPSKYLLDDPLPENVHIVPACNNCNQGFSKDEEYVGSLLDTWMVGTTTDVSRLRSKVRAKLEEKPRLEALITKTLNSEPVAPAWEQALGRIEGIIVKLAQGHAAYELGESILWEYSKTAGFSAFHAMDATSRERFENASRSGALWPGVGTRIMQRLASGMEDWVVVQDGNYRYHALTDNAGHHVRMG